MFIKVIDHGYEQLLNLNAVKDIGGSIYEDELHIALANFSGQRTDFYGKEAEVIIRQIDDLSYEDRNRLFSKEAQEYLGNLLVEKDKKQKELDSEVS